MVLLSLLSACGPPTSEPTPPSLCCEDPPGWWPDADGDGVGAETGQVTQCAAPDGFVALSGDCDDADPAVSPGATEQCNGRDDNCDDVAEPPSARWFPDADLDGAGDDALGEDTCWPSSGWIATGGDCDDANADVFPGAVETCNLLDDDCDGGVDEDFDRDGDGALDLSCPGGSDCDEEDPEVFPGATETCGDGVDDDCSGEDAACGYGASVDLETDADFRLETSTLTDLGRVVAAGDLTGDGQADLLAASLTTDRTFVLPGPVGSGGDTASIGFLITTGSSTISGAGRNVGLADATGDGLLDLGVGAPYGSVPGMYVLEGPVTSAALLTDATFHFDCAAGQFCGHGAELTDLNADGVADAVVGAYWSSSTTTTSGSTYVVFGPLEGERSSEDADVVIAGPSQSALSGRFVRAGGDLDGDGVGDVLISAPYYSNSAPHAGAVFVVHGPPVDLGLDDADARIEALEPNALLGEERAFTAGDVDGDGLDDVVVGSYLGGGGAGAAWVMRGPVTGETDVSAAWFTVEGSRTAAVGTGLLVADADTDGAMDLLLAASGSYGGNGSALLFAAPASGTYTTSDATTTFRGEGELGFGVASGDLDGDGFDDLAFGATALGGVGGVLGVTWPGP